MASNLRLPYALATAAICAGVASAAASASPISIPLTQHSGPVDPVQHARHAATKSFRRRSPAHADYATTAETLSGGFWFGSFDVGDSTDLSLLIDTGSSDVGVNPNKYQPSSASQNLNDPISYNYATVLENGCGISDISAAAYTDTVSFQGLTATGQSLYSINYTPQTNPGIITQLPHDGIVGFAGTSGGSSLVGGTPFFQSLCDQNAVEECRFGLAFGTDGSGTQVLGGVDTGAFTGDLTRVDVQSQWYASGDVVDGSKTLFDGVNILFDSGTAGIVASASQVREYFQQAGIHAQTVNAEGCQDAVFGYYACDAPPTLGFRLGDAGTTFTVAASALQLADNGDNNCTVWITGLDDESFGENFWILGQNFMQGKYLDFDSDSNSVGIAALK